jgi:hypothetical protein
MKTELLGGKIKGKIKFLGGKKETQEVGSEIFNDPISYYRNMFPLNQTSSSSTTQPFVVVVDSSTSTQQLCSVLGTSCDVK